jgi:outer membrane lipopolysaccharide assembly protein LptE/RlpB
MARTNIEWVAQVSLLRPGFLPSLCHPDRSVAQWRDLRFSCPCLEIFSTGRRFHRPGKSRCDNSDSMRGRFVLLFAVISLAGCGYHTLGSAAHMPDTVHTLAVPIFKNKTQYYHTEVPMTQAVVHEFTDRTRLHVTPVSGEDADATVSGTILSASVQPLTYRTQTTAATTTGQTTSSTSSFLITINVNVVVTDRDQRVLYQHNNYLFHEQFETTADVASFIQEDSPAVQRLSRDFAQALVSDILESF